MINQMDTIIAKYLSALGRDEATDWSGSHPLSLPHAVLRRRWKVVPTRRAQASRRLAWAQKMARDPEAHSQVIAALWGALNDGPLAQDPLGRLAREAPPLARQAAADLRLFDGASGTED
eukprot:5872675-Pyramimonas_sp.AAC.1